MLCNEHLSFLITDERRLHLAASTNNVNLLLTLLRCGVNPNCRDDQSRSSLHLAACRGYQDIVRFVRFLFCKHPVCMYKGYLENNLCLL
jgi:ankyrin repeat protein